MKNTLKAGLYQRIITPQVNAPLIGGFDAGKAEDIFDEFHAKALVLDDGKKETAIVSVDVIGISAKIVEDIVERVEKFCGIPKEQVMVHAVHNHTGVRLFEEGNDAYTEFFKESIVSAVYLAQKRKQNVRIGVGKGSNSKYVFNRRLKKPDGSVIMNWTDRDFLQDCDGSGVVDPGMLVVKLEDESGKPVGFIVNYANHNNSVWVPSRSADISGHISELLRKLYGDHVMTIFLLGACGNTNWVDFKDYSQKEDAKLYQRIATGLTGTALQIIAEMEYPEIDGIDLAWSKLCISERPYSDYDDKVDLTFGRFKDSSKENAESAFRFFKDAKENGKDKPLATYELDIHALRLGKEIALATNPVELFADFGLEIKEGSPFKYTMVSELTNGSFGYVPTQYAYEEGGYEVRKPASRMERDAGDRIVQRSLELLKDLKNKHW